MALQFEEPINDNIGRLTFFPEKVYMTMIATTTTRSRVKLWRLWCPLYRDFFTMQDFPKNCIKLLLQNVGIVPSTFYDGRDCDMIDKLSRMLRHFAFQRRGFNADHMCVFVMVSSYHCFYNIVNFPFFFYTQLVPSSEYVQTMAREGGVFSLPAGSTTLRRIEVEDKEENCAICLEGFYSGHAAMLPCSHVCHSRCILEWFVQSGTCPLCRFPCTLP